MIMKKISRKQFLSLAGVSALTLGLAACGGSDASSTAVSSTATGDDTASTPSFAKKKIAIAWNASDDHVLNSKKHLDGEIGALLNLEFTHSEAISDAGALTTFIENSYASGCDAVMTNVTSSIDQAAAVCNDLGMYFVGISSADANENQELPYYVSVCGASAAGYGESYSEALKSVIGDGAEHSIVIMSGAACYGATSFIEGTAGSLRALQDVYGLTYNDDLNALATSTTQVDATNDKGIKITIVPGMADLANTVSPLLQTGEYDVVVGTTDIYSSLSIAINEVEEALGKNISLISRNAFSDMVSDAFHTTDSTGHPSLDAIVSVGQYEILAGVIILRNALDGYAEQMRDNGRCSRVPGMRPTVVTSAEQYDVLSGGDIPYSFITEEEILSMCSLLHPEVTYAEIDAMGAEQTGDSLMTKFA
jgi:hypothetical protein